MEKSHTVKEQQTDFDVVEFVDAPPASTKENTKRAERAERAAAAGSPWLTAEQAATYAQVSVKVIYAACWDPSAPHRRGRREPTNKLRHARVGGRRDLRFRAEWLDAWLEASAPQEVST